MRSKLAAARVAAAPAEVPATRVIAAAEVPARSGVAAIARVGAEVAADAGSVGVLRLLRRLRGRPAGWETAVPP